MSHALERVLAVLMAHGLTDRLVEFEAELPTAAAAAAQLGCPTGAIANSLIFRAGDDEAVLVVASGAHRVDVVKAGAQLGGEPLRRADPELVLHATGQVVGGVAPVGHPAPLRTLIDRDLAGYDELWAGGGEKHAMMRLSYPELVAVTGGIEADVA